MRGAEIMGNVVLKLAADADLRRAVADEFAKERNKE